MKLLLPLAMAAVLAGCATSPIPAEQAKPVPNERLSAFQSPPQGPHGTIVMTRDTGMAGARNDVKVWIAGRRAAEIGVGETAKFYVPAGEVIIGARLDEFLSNRQLVERATEVKQGQTKRYRISITPGVGIDVSPTAF